MQRVGWRWAVLALAVAVLGAVPSAVAALPTAGGGTDPQALLERVRASDDVAYTGYGEARGDLVLPDVDALGELPDLISGTTRLRAFWRGRDDFRVDALSLVGELDVVTDPQGTWTWDSADRLATLVRGDLDVRLPRGADLLAPALGARLSRSEGLTVTGLPSRRVAGRTAAGLRLEPDPQAPTTIERVDLWADPETGLPLQVELHGRDDADRPAGSAALTSLLLDVDLGAPTAERTRFRPPPGARVEAVDAPDLAAASDRFAPFALPATLAGLGRQDRVDDLGQGVATYGTGLSALTLVPLDRGTSQRLLEQLTDGPGLDEAEISTALLQGLVARRGDRAYLLVGTVPQTTLRAGLAQLAAAPPPLRAGFG